MESSQSEHFDRKVSTGQITQIGNARYQTSPISRREKGFDFRGYSFARKPVRFAEATVRKHVERLYRLYEQQIIKKATPEEVALVLGNYVKRWQCWCTAGLTPTLYEI